MKTSYHVLNSSVIYEKLKSCEVLTTFNRFGTCMTLQKNKAAKKQVSKSCYY